MKNVIVELKEKAHKLIIDARKVAEKATTEGRAMNAEENAKFDAMFADASALKADAERMEKTMTLETGLKLEAGKRPDEAPEGRKDTREAEHRAAFLRYLVNNDDKALRSLSMDTVGEGGYLVPEVIEKKIMTGINNNLFMRQICTVLPPVIGAISLGLPYMSADATDGEWTTEILGATQDDTLAIGKRSLQPKFLVKRILASMKLLQHSPLAEQFIIDRIAYKMAVPQENKFLNGGGTTEPLGVFTASNDGIPVARDVSAQNEATAFTAEGLKNAKYAVAAQYRRNASWVMHRDAVKMAAKLTDGQGRYLWADSLKAGEPDMLMGHPVYESEYAPSTFTSGLYVAVFGDFKTGYQIVDGLGMSVQRLNELYAATNQIGFIPRMYTDGMPVLSSAFARVKLG